MIRNVEAKLPKALASTVAKKVRPAYHDPDALGAEATLDGRHGRRRRVMIDSVVPARVGVDDDRGESRDL